jgi:signal transduction histidine kinase
VQPLIREAVRMVSERAKSRKLALVTTAPEEEIAVWGDERAIKQILLNLLSNAVKFSNDGGQVDIRASFDNAGDLVLDVEDYGIGMAAKEIDRALEPFGQAKPAVTKTHGGTGLGLPIAKGLTNAHGGKLVVRSSPRQGTLVSILLPQQSRSPDAAQDLRATILDPSGAERAVA